MGRLDEVLQAGGRLRAARGEQEGGQLLRLGPPSLAWPSLRKRPAPANRGGNGEETRGGDESIDSPAMEVAEVVQVWQRRLRLSIEEIGPSFWYRATSVSIVWMPSSRMASQRCVESSGTLRGPVGERMTGQDEVGGRHDPETPERGKIGPGVAPVAGHHVGGVTAQWVPRVREGGRLAEQGRDHVAGEEDPRAAPLQQVAEAPRRMPRRGQDLDPGVSEGERLVVVEFPTSTVVGWGVVGHVVVAEEGLARPSRAERPRRLGRRKPGRLDLTPELLGAAAMVAMSVRQEDGAGLPPVSPSRVASTSSVVSRPARVRSR